MALTRNEIKFIKSLQDKKSREHERCFVVEGVKLVEELLNQPAFRIKALYCTPNLAPEILQKSNFVEISDSDLERISGLVTPNKVLAVVAFPEPVLTDWKFENSVVVLDDIKDPGNLGTILRTADWFGIKSILASETCVDLFNPKVIQASMGAVYRVKYHQMPLAQSLPKLKDAGFTLTGAAMNGTNLFNHTYTGKLALIMGSESHGISEKVTALLDEKITIPKFGETESLNVAIAAGIILAHYRQVVGVV